MITFETEYGKIIIHRDKKDNTKLFYRFIPTKDFEKQSELLIEKTEGFQKKLEQDLNKKLADIYSYE